jgi:hypothetical protein
MNWFPTWVLHGSCSRPGAMEARLSPMAVGGAITMRDDEGKAPWRQLKPIHELACSASLV